MANEITITAAVRCSNGNFVHQSDVGTKQFDQATGSGGTPGVLSVTTTAEAVSFGDVTPGVVWIRNLSTASTVRLQTTAGDPFSRFVPGMIGIVPKSTGGWQVRASTAGGSALIDIRGYST